MAEKDLAGKKIEDYNEVFADIYNTLLFRKDFLVSERVKREGGAVTMCVVADALINEGMQKGKVELLYEMNYSVAEIAERLDISEEKVQEILQN